VLVDHDAGALVEAARETPATQRDVVEADLATAAGAEAVRAALGDAEGAVLVTCFEVLHQLADFTALVELLLELGARATVVLSVPDDAAGALDDPHRRSAWSAGAAEELRRLLPADAVVLRQVAIRASAVVPADGPASVTVGAVEVPADAAAVHHLLAFGPGAARLAPTARARAADLDAERADARRRESDLAYLEARLAQLEVPASG
jgi:hypothetical protein